MEHLPGDRVCGDMRAVKQPRAPVEQPRAQVKIQKAVQGPLQTLDDMHTHSLGYLVAMGALTGRQVNGTDNQTDRQTTGNPGGKVGRKAHLGLWTDGWTGSNTNRQADR